MDRRLLCPRCGLGLVTGTLDSYARVTPATEERASELVAGEVEVDGCSTCGGFWLDRGELEQVDNVIEPTPLEIRRIPDKQTQQVELTCPGCGAHPMGKVVHEADRHVVMDVCPDCGGTWLDGGELTAIRKQGIFSVIRYLLRR